MKNLISKDNKDAQELCNGVGEAWALRRGERAFPALITHRLRSKQGRGWGISVTVTSERDQRSEGACCAGRTVCHALLLEREVHGGALGDALDARKEHLDILLKGVVSQTYFPSDLPVFPNSSSLYTLWIYCILLRIKVVLFELLSGRKQRMTIKRTGLEKQRTNSKGTTDPTLSPV